MRNNKERWVIVYTRTSNVPLVFHWHDESWTKQDALDKTKLSCEELLSARDCTSKEEMQIEALQFCKEATHEAHF